MFPEATGIFFHDNELNGYVAIPRDENGHLKFDCSSNVMYELVYRYEPQNRSISPLSNTSKIWNWLTIAGSLFKSTNSTSHYKKQYSDTFSYIIHKTFCVLFQYKIR
ncbi:unnamed protein product [Rotaria magnacalcarata]